MNATTLPLLLPLDDARATLATVGGKGANLARLARAGFPVPGGFLVTTAAYAAFVAARGLHNAIARALDGLDATDPAALDTASAQIRAAFDAAPLPRTIEQAIRSAYAELGAPPVAVRSSATAEDLPDFSFAGQQDSYLNVVGAKALGRAVVNCWASLWTARAIGYRARNDIAQGDVALAVVVQQMVQSEASGVLFTANPLTGLRAETVIDATLGLGEALVSGQVEPDHYVVESASGVVRSRTLGAKALAIRSVPGGGVETVAQTAAGTPALPDHVVADLTALGRRVAAEYGGAPQDIEWARADGQLYLLQARPITSLFPLPTTLPPDELALLFSFGAVQGLLDPLTPMGQEVFRRFSAAFARIWGYDFAPGAVPAIHFAGERMWIRFDPLLRNKATRRIWRAALHLIDAAASAAFESIVDDPRLMPTRAAPEPQTIRRVLGGVVPVLPRLAATLRDPESARADAEAFIANLLADFTARAAAAHTLRARLDTVESFFASTPAVILNLVPRLVVGIGSFYRLLGLAEKAGVAHAAALEMVRALPHNVTTEMDLALWQVAQTVRADAAAAQALQAGEAAALAQDYLAGNLPATAQRALADFLRVYGMRGVGEIDMGRPRWREQPTQVVQMVQNYLQITDPAQAPDAVFARGAAAAARVQAQVIETIRATLGPRAATQAAWLAARMRALAGMREAPKFAVVRILGIVRALLLESFGELAAASVLESAQDGFYLTFAELRALDAGYAIDWRALVRERRALYAREARRRLLPVLLVSDGRTFYGGADGAAAANGAAGDDEVLVGSPVSPGVAEGVVHVVFEPHGAQLRPGEILVCPGTDPAWTPLFLSAGALVMEVGGMMTHGAVVAREYGIPAVVGVRAATRRLRDGQRVRVDGATGRITRLEPARGAPAA